ncbi:MAG: ABC transporter substrate-binding protein, partial [Acidobacteria bacterium]|nr:ABC transporter substrate-binding protein [Acidobacteriota bacterium]
VGPYDDEKLGFHKIARYYYYPGWWEPGPNLSYYVNRDAWNELPRAYQEMFEVAAAESATFMQARYDALNPGAFERLLADGVELRRFSDEILKAALEETRDFLEEEAARDSSYRKLYESWKKVRSGYYKWFASAELGYQGFAFPRG